jgi:ABC-type transport system involved in multi-copper enzyme maturation permease subunit
MVAIVKREIQAHLHSQQFFVLLALSVVLFAMSAWVTSKTHHEQMAQYREGVTSNASSPDTRFTYLYAEPSPLGFVAAGSASCRHAGYGLTAKGGWLPRYRRAQNFKLPSVPDLDWVFIISVVFSLYALLLSFRSVSGEKQSGTLRLTLSNALGRSGLLLAKYLATLLTIAPALLIGVLVNLTMVSVLFPDALQMGLIPRMVAALVLGLLLISAFIFLGLLVSCLVTPSAVVLLVVLSVWIVLVIIVPNVSGIVANMVAEVPSEFEAARQEPLCRSEVGDEMRALRGRVEGGELTDRETIERAARELFDQGLEKIRDVYMAYDEATRRRIATGRRIARASPIALFQYASESLANTGFIRDGRFLRDVKAYSEIYDQYILEKTGELIPFVGWGIVFQTELDGETIEVQSWTENYEGDMSDFPVFVETPCDLRQGVREAVLDLGGLAFWNLILAALAFAAFARCDVR